MNYYTFYWRDGTKSILQGATAESAFSLNYPTKAAHSIEHHMVGIDHTYYWDIKKNVWVRKNDLRLQLSVWIGMSSEEKLATLKSAKTVDIEDADGWHFGVSFTTYLDEDLGYYYVGNFSHHHSTPEFSDRELKNGVVGRLYVDPDHLDPLVQIIGDFIALKPVKFQTLDEILAEKALR